MHAGAGLHDHISQLRGQYTVINVISGMICGRQQWVEGSDTKAWLGDCNLTKAMTLQPNQGHDTAT
jgi:hypothetical protein